MTGRGLALIAVLIACALLCGCGYTVVESKSAVEIGTGDTYVAPRETPAFDGDEEGI